MELELRGNNIGGGELANNSHNEDEDKVDEEEKEGGRAEQNGTRVEVPLTGCYHWSLEA